MVFVIQTMSYDCYSMMGKRWEGYLSGTYIIEQAGADLSLNTYNKSYWTIFQDHVYIYT